MLYGDGGVALPVDRPDAGSRFAYDVPGDPMLLIGEGAAADAAEAAIRLAGGRLLQRIDWSAAATTLPRLATWPVLVIETVGVSADVLDAQLPQIGAYIQRAAVAAVVTLGEDQIDVVAAHLFGDRVQLLCMPDTAQRVAALAVACERPQPMLHDSWREDDKERLDRLNHEVAHIARLLAGLTRDAPMPREIADRRRSYGGEPPADNGQTVAAQDVRRLIQLRQLRGKFFGAFVGDGLFEDPAWDMLLDLYAAELEGTRVSVSSLCIAAGVAPTTALRWIAKMTEMELFIRHPDPVDRRRAFMALSPRASDAMRGYLIARRRIELG
jgi:DNA-binding MarR family transcriptional regulator